MSFIADIFGFGDSGGGGALRSPSAPPPPPTRFADYAVQSAGIAQRMGGKGGFDIGSALTQPASTARKALLGS